MLAIWNSFWNTRWTVQWEDRGALLDYASRKADAEREVYSRVSDIHLRIELVLDCSAD